MYLAEYKKCIFYTFHEKIIAFSGYLRTINKIDATLLLCPFHQDRPLVKNVLSDTKQFFRKPLCVIPLVRSEHVSYDF